MMINRPSANSHRTEPRDQNGDKQVATRQATRHANRRTTSAVIAAGPFFLFLHWCASVLRHEPLQQLNTVDSLTLHSQHDSKNTTCNQSKREKAKKSRVMPDIPNVLIVGAQKSGATAVQSWIEHNKNVCKAASAPDGKPIKEVHFFNNDSRFSNGPDFCKRHHQHCTETSSILIDSTPDCLPHAARVRETHNQFGESCANDLKTLMILREPISRECSWFNHMVVDAKKPNPPPCTKKVLDDKRKGGGVVPFAKHLEKHVHPDMDSSFGQHAGWSRLWMDHFDRKQILALSCDELISDPVSFLGRIQKFLGLKEGRIKDEVAVRNKKTGTMESPPLCCKAQARLHKAFSAANNDLHELPDKCPGPEMEQRPFPRFQLSPCTPDKPKRQKGNNMQQF